MSDGGCSIMRVTWDFESTIQNSDCLDKKTRQHGGYSGCTTVWTIWGSISGRGNRFYSSQKRPDRLWRPTSLLFSGCHFLFSPSKIRRSWSELYTHLHVVSRLRMSGDRSSLHPHIHSWREQGQSYCPLLGCGFNFIRGYIIFIFIIIIIINIIISFV